MVAGAGARPGDAFETERNSFPLLVAHRRAVLSPAGWLEVDVFASCVYHVIWVFAQDVLELGMTR
jgi:hypothetical protein